MKRVLQFASNRSVPQIIEGITRALAEMECEVRVFDSTNKVRSRMRLPGSLWWVARDDGQCVLEQNVMV